MKGKRLLYIVNSADFFMSHRLPLALAAMKRGFDVHVAVGEGGGEALEAHNVKCYTIPLTRSGRGLATEIRCFLSVFRLLRKLKPDVVHMITIKPVVYGGIAARMLLIKGRAFAIPGLGFVFLSKGFRAKFLRALIGQLYKLALGGSGVRIIFQNPDDLQLFKKLRFLGRRAKYSLIRGSGVDLADYQAESEHEGFPVVCMAARLLKDKGVNEYFFAAQLLRQRGVTARFLLAGDIDPGNPASISEQTLEAWKVSNVLEILGYRRDISNLFASSSIVVLPSYREGLPKVLLEAAACGRAVVTTDVPGCRDAIEPNVTGLLVPACDSVALADAIQRLIENPELRQRMGQAGRELAEREFGIERVIDQHMTIYRELGDSR